MNGVIILDKPAGFTSFDAVAVMRGLTHEKKIGHTGTLDPMATGVLPLLLGRAAKAADLLPDTDKEYLAGFRLGEARDTGDITGRVVKEDEATVTEDALKNAMARFQGEIDQVPPMYSAVSVGGRRLYELARKGIEIERKTRRVAIDRLELLRYDEKKREGEMLISCSKGTYIRTLLEDIAETAGTCGEMTSLRRTRACGFSEADALPLEDVKKAAEDGGLYGLLRPVETLFEGYPPVTVSPAQAMRFRNGGSLSLERLRMNRMTLLEGDRLCVFENGGGFLGLARADMEKGELRFLKLLE